MNNEHTFAQQLYSVLLLLNNSVQQNLSIPKLVRSIYGESLNSSDSRYGGLIRLKIFELFWIHLFITFQGGKR